MHVNCPKTGLSLAIQCGCGELCDFLDLDKEGNNTIGRAVWQAALDRHDVYFLTTATTETPVLCKCREMAANELAMKDLAAAGGIVDAP